MTTTKLNNRNIGDICKKATTLIALISFVLLVHLCSPAPETFGPEKTFVVDKSNMNFRPFLPAAVRDFDAMERNRNHYFYVQDANNAVVMFERRIIVRRIEDGQFFVAKFKDQLLKLQKGQRIKLTFVQYWQSATVMNEQLVAELDTSQ